MNPIKRLLTPVSFTSISLQDNFWAPRIEINRQKSIPHIYQKLKETGRISAFDLNFNRPVPSPIVHIFGDSDPAKWLEAACYSLATHADPDLEQIVDQIVNKIISAQQPDGYLNTHFIVTQPEMRWKNLRDWHEMYCAGHLMEAAVAHYQATENPRLLNALSRYADHIDANFGTGPGKKRGYAGHPEIELALVRMYHATGNDRYLNLAKYLVEERGAQPHYYDLEARQRGEDPASFWAKTYEYCQAHLPIRQQEKVVGHAVRAMYLLCGVADLAHEFDDGTLLETCERLWDNLLTKRMYLTGGIGPSRHNEGFTQDYDLPDESAYAETCATIGLILWNHRMLQFGGDRKYTDVIERGLYNGFLSGVSLDGTRFFYENPLASAGEHHRSEWFYCPCCPPNVARIIASVGNYFYSTGLQDIWVHLFAESEAVLNVGGQTVQVKQQTHYPWDGAVNFQIQVKQPAAFHLHIRLPGWCDKFSVRLNGKVVDISPGSNGYLSIHRTWKSGDVVSYEMTMPVRPVWANPAIRQLQGRLAIQRGPMVYCLEGVDHHGIILDRIAVDPRRVSREFQVDYQPDLLGGIAVIHGRATQIDDQGWEGVLYRSTPPENVEIPITAVPYCTWDNRGPGEMRVWLRAA